MVQQSQIYSRPDLNDGAFCRLDLQGQQQRQRKQWGLRLWAKQLQGNQGYVSTAFAVLSLLKAMINRVCSPEFGSRPCPLLAVLPNFLAHKETCRPE